MLTRSLTLVTFSDQSLSPINILKARELTFPTSTGSDMFGATLLPLTFDVPGSADVRSLPDEFGGLPTHTGIDAVTVNNKNNVQPLTFGSSSCAFNPPLL